MKEYKLELSAFAKGIKEQLESQGVYMTEFNYDKYEDIRHSINMLGFHISTPSEVKRNVDRFYKKIQEDVFDEPLD